MGPGVVVGGGLGVGVAKGRVFSAASALSLAIVPPQALSPAPSLSLALYLSPGGYSREGLARTWSFKAGMGMGDGEGGHQQVSGPRVPRCHDTADPIKGGEPEGRSADAQVLGARQRLRGGRHALGRGRGGKRDATVCGWGLCVRCWAAGVKR